MSWCFSDDVPHTVFRIWGLSGLISTKRLTTSDWSVSWFMAAAVTWHCQSPSSDSRETSRIVRLQSPLSGVLRNSYFPRMIPIPFPSWIQRHSPCLFRTRQGIFIEDPVVPWLFINNYHGHQHHFDHHHRHHVMLSDFRSAENNKWEEEIKDEWVVHWVVLVWCSWWWRWSLSMIMLQVEEEAIEWWVVEKMMIWCL